MIFACTIIATMLVTAMIVIIFVTTVIVTIAAAAVIIVVTIIRFAVIDADVNAIAIAVTLESIVDATFTVVWIYDTAVTGTTSTVV